MGGLCSPPPHSGGPGRRGQRLSGARSCQSGGQGLPKKHNHVMLLKASPGKWYIFTSAHIPLAKAGDRNQPNISGKYGAPMAVEDGYLLSSDKHVELCEDLQKPRGHRGTM